MKQIALGTTGEKVSALCLGCMYFGTKVDEAMSSRNSGCIHGDERVLS